ncbi:MAG: serine/threonine protein kinase [Clostridia bacterium]|nr:serine/threonine protein kinase [Clostridia bacterium]
MIVNQKNYKLLKLLGHGKGGYSYLVESNGKQFVLKQIHHEPCSYYQFGNKIEAEQNDYHRLLQAGIRIPKMIDIDIPNERILKEYIDGQTIFDMIKDGISVQAYMSQIYTMAEQAKRYGLNIDYFPTNFVVQNELLYYIDYECNTYSDTWNFDNWGIKYWSKTEELINYIHSQKSKEKENN